MIIPNCLDKQEVVIRRAIIRVNPDYFSLPSEAQEKYCCSLSDKDYLGLCQALLKALFAINVKTEEEMKWVLDSFTEEEHLLFNSTLLPLCGIGEDCFYLNEWLCDDQTILDFNTLYDYDFDNHCYQEQAFEEEFTNYQKKPYRGRFYFSWARLFIESAFYYADLSMASSYIYYKLDEAGVGKINQLIPHELVKGSNHGKNINNGIVWNMKENAEGRESQLEELKKRYDQYSNDRCDYLAKEFDKNSQKQVYLIEGTDNEPKMSFIFSDKTVLQAVRFRNFMNDCRIWLGATSELNEIIKQEEQAALQFIEEAYLEILNNFEPKIVKLPKKQKIILVNDAVDLL